MNSIHSTAPEQLTADRKALKINLDDDIYGTFAEIGAGQEVARHFFRVGGAAGTIAKTMSAYDMIFSDEIYGKVGRYVSRERLMSMLDHEYELLLQRLAEKRGSETTFFVFANTVAARNYKGTNECHGWLGVRFQAEKCGPPNDIVIHVRMTDHSNILQQQALGIIGVNLLYGAFYYRDDPDTFIAGLIDELSIDRIEVDMLEFSGPALKGIDNRLLSLKLVQRGLTNAIMFAPNGKVLQPSEVLRKKPILISRGSFRPVTNVNVDMIESALAQFKSKKEVCENEPVALFEITLNNLLATGTLDDSDFLARADTLSTLGYPVLISDYSEHYRLTSYFRRYTSEPIAMVVGINSLFRIFEEKYYNHLKGGILEALGHLFYKSVTLLVYPMNRDYYLALAQQYQVNSILENAANLPEIITVDEVHVAPHLRHLFKYLRESGQMESIREYNNEYLAIVSREVLSSIQSGRSDWEAFVPKSVATLIKSRGMFGATSSDVD